MVKKDAKAKAAEKKARTAAKQTKKTAKSSTKATKKQKTQDADSSDDDNTDLDAVLASYAEQQARFLAVTETPCDPPSARSSATLLANPQNERELLLFGGESFEGQLARFYNDLFVYNTRKDAWGLVSSANAPLNRSGHAWCVHPNSKMIYLFGGEFSSPKQGTFYHYSDFWILDPGTREWSRIEPKGKPPSARSGHRMVGWKGNVLLFGGFRDTSGGTTYLNDVYVFDTSAKTWYAPPPPPGTQRPDARSSFSFLPHENGAVLYGGYSRVKATAKSKTGASKVSEIPVVHQDAWTLRVTAGEPPVIRWEKRKRPANVPNPPRAGATMASHKGRGISFGGVWDTERSEEGLESEFFNDLGVWNVERNRWFQLSLRRPRARKVDAGDKGGRRKKQGDEELLERLKELEAKDGVVEGVEELGLSDEEDEDEKPVEKPVMWEMPHPRFNAQLAVQNDVVYVFGGTYERGDKEFTFDEVWAIDLGKLDGCREIYRREIPGWGADEVDEEDKDEDEDDEGSDSGGSQDDDEMNDAPSLPTETTISSDTAFSPITATAQEVEEEPKDTSSLQNSLPHPRLFESLRSFYARTSQEWQSMLLNELGNDRSAMARSVKEIRKKAFERAEEQWWDCREEIQALEDEQEEAGIGEVVNLKEKQVAGGGVAGSGRRR